MAYTGGMKLYALRVKTGDPKTEQELREAISAAVATYMREHPEVAKDIVVDMEDVTNAHLEDDDAKEN